MSKSKTRKQRPYNFGRVFFPSQPNPDPAIPNEIRFQPLGNHVGNVRRLVKLWKSENFDEESRERVLKAADIHDMAKPQRFEIKVGTQPKTQKFENYIYSFKGHRFLAECKDSDWVERLARGHHKFTIDDISRDTYELKNDRQNPKESEKYADLLAKDPLLYAKELYILEMCDQIEAELACRTLDDKKQADDRTFMEYTITREESEENEYIYRIDPYPFAKSEIELNFKYWEFNLSEANKQELQKLRDENKDSKLGKKLDEIVKIWWQQQEKNPKENSKKITIKPYDSDENIGLDTKDIKCKDWYEKLANFQPNSMQKEVFNLIANHDNPALLLKSPTGSGKFEAILFSCLAKGYRLILPLPARSLVEDQQQRAEKYLKKISSLYENREFSLVLDTGSVMKRKVYINGEETKPRTRNIRRHLYKGDIILTTLDKFLYRYFAYGDNQKSFIFPLRINDEKTLICFDEAHSYDTISFTNFYRLVESLYENGRSLVLMTATMSEKHLKRFDYLEAIDYVSNSEKSAQIEQFKHPKRLTWIDNIKCRSDDQNDENKNEFAERFTKIVVREWKAKPNSKIIAVVETVKDAVEIYKKLKQETGLTREQIFLYHGRIAEQIRPLLYEKIKESDSNNNPYLLVTTGAIEVGCDLNCEILISQICPPENLIQRAGRCNRKGDLAEAKVIVIGDLILDYMNNLDENEWNQYSQILQELKTFNTEKIVECITRSEHIDDYRVVELFSMLHEYVYQADLTCKPIHDKGLIPTRSWQPSVNLVYEGVEPKHSISVSIERFCSGEKYADVYACEKTYNKETTKWEEKDLGWGSAYKKEITVRIPPGGVDVSLPNYEYHEELGFVEIPKIFTKLTKKGANSADVKLLYTIEGKHKSIVTYTASLEEK